MIETEDVIVDCDSRLHSMCLGKSLIRSLRISIYVDILIYFNKLSQFNSSLSNDSSNNDQRYTDILYSNSNDYLFFQ